MLKGLCIGDPHFKSDNGEETQALTEKIPKLIRERTPDFVVILGDILHRHEKIDLSPFHRANNFLKAIHNELIVYGGYLYIVIGNHDRSNNTIFMTDEHVFNPLKEWKNTFVADKAIVHEGVTTRYSKNPGVPFKCMIIPYVPPGRLLEAIASVDPDYVKVKDEFVVDKSSEDDPTGIKDSEDGFEIELDQLEYSDYFKKSINMVFTHQEFMGAKMNTITSNAGDPWPSTNPLCVSGHIHDYQVLAANLIYTGTPIQHGFADSSRKTVSWIDMDISVPTIKTRYTEERINLGIKGRRQFSIKSEEFIDHLKHFVAEAENSYVKLKISGSKQSLKTLSKYPEYKRMSLNPHIKMQLLETLDHDIPKQSVSLPDTKTQIPFRKRLETELGGLHNAKDIQDLFRSIFN